MSGSKDHCDKMLNHGLLDGTPCGEKKVRKLIFTQQINLILTDFKDYILLFFYYLNDSE